MVARHSRPEAFSKILTTIADEPGKKASLIDDARYDDFKGDLKLRGIQAGAGIVVNVVDADDNAYDSMDADKASETKIVISSLGAVAGEIFAYVAPISIVDQTAYPLPFVVSSVLTVTINGLETSNYTFTLGPATVTIDLVAEGYGIDLDDEVMVLYKAI